MKPIQIGGQSEFAFSSVYEVIGVKLAIVGPQALASAASVRPRPTPSLLAAR